jgi:hypothetical protein
VPLVVGDNWNQSFAKIGSKLCRSCLKLKNQEYAKRDPSKRTEVKMAWRANNLTKARESQHRYGSKPEVKSASSKRQLARVAKIKQASHTCMVRPEGNPSLL